MYTNRGLHEIKEHSFLDKIKREFERTYKNYGSMTPFICGTIVNNGLCEQSERFIRKIKMLRAPLYALL